MNLFRLRGGVNENVPHRLMYLSSWLQLVELFKKVGGGLPLGLALRFQGPVTFPVTLLSLSLIPAYESDVSSQLLLQHCACLPAAMISVLFLRKI